MAKEKKETRVLNRYQRIIDGIKVVVEAETLEEANKKLNAKEKKKTSKE